MADIIEAFTKAKSDGIIDKNELQKELSGFSVEDWRKVIQSQNGTEMMLNKVRVEEKDSEFVIHNDEQEIRTKDILAGVGSFLRGAVLTGAGFGIGRFIARPYSGLIGTGVGFLAGYLWHRHTMGPIEELKENGMTLKIAKNTLPEAKVAMLGTTTESNLSTAMLAKNHQRINLAKFTA